MKQLPDLFSFCECCHLKKLDKQQNKTDYDNKYFLDASFCHDNKRKTAYIIHII